MSVEPYYIIKDILMHANHFSWAESLLFGPPNPLYPFFDRVSNIEKGRAEPNRRPRQSRAREKQGNAVSDLDADQNHQLGLQVELDWIPLLNREPVDET